MNSRFDKYLKVLRQDDIDKDQLQATLDELHKSFATLTQEEQKYANIFIHDVQSGNIEIEDGNSFRDYITEYQFRAKNEQVSTAIEVDLIQQHTLVSYLQVDATTPNNRYVQVILTKTTAKGGKEVRIHGYK
jgi:type I restriction enzyme, R subunit